MAYDRTSTGPWVWLKAVGTADDPLSANWPREDAHLLEHVWFPKRPRSLRADDLLVYYAAGLGVLPGIARLLTDEPVDEPESHPKYGARWPWKMGVEPIVTVSLEIAPTLAYVGIDPLRVRRQSHIRLEPHEVEVVRRRLAEAVWKAAELPLELVA